MSKRLMILVLALALVACFSAAAYAEVQNIKVSGDLLMQGVTRTNFTLTKDAKYANAGFITHARVRVDADLTDNVSATIRLLNERSWGNDGWGSNGGLLPQAPLTLLANNGDNTGDEVTIDLAYATLKEFFYAPLTITIGRQEMRFGSGLVVADVDTNRFANEWQIPWDLSLRKSFDGGRLTLNYDPVVVDAIYSKIEENDVWWMQTASLGPVGQREKNDTNLYGVNLRYDMSGLGFKGTTDLYGFSRVSNWSDGNIVAGERLKDDTCNTVGFLTQGQIIKNLSASLEGAYQFGTDSTGFFNPSLLRPNAARSAFAAEATVSYDLKDMHTIGKYMPRVTGIYGMLSGSKHQDGTKDSQRAWDPMFEDKSLNSVVNAIFPNTNTRYAGLIASCKPIEDVTLSGVYGYYWFDRKVANGAIATTYTIFGPLDGPAGVAVPTYSADSNKHMGQAVDLTGTYDYTEDVQFGLTWGVFFPGKGIDRTAGLKYDQAASQVIGSMKVTF